MRGPLNTVWKIPKHLTSHTRACAYFSDILFNLGTLLYSTPKPKTKSIHTLYMIQYIIPVYRHSFTQLRCGFAAQYLLRLAAQLAELAELAKGSSKATGAGRQLPNITV